MYAETAVSPALSAIAPARHWARDRLAEAGVDDGRLDLLVLLVSELVTNAVAHADPPVDPARARRRRAHPRRGHRRRPRRARGAQPAADRARRARA